MRKIRIEFWGSENLLIAGNDIRTDLSELNCVTNEMRKSLHEGRLCSRRIHYKDLPEMNCMTNEIRKALSKALTGT